MKYQKFKRYIFQPLSKNINLLGKHIYTLILKSLRNLGTQIHSFMLNFLRNLGKLIHSLILSFLRNLEQFIHSIIINLLRSLGRIVKKNYRIVTNYNYYNFLKFLKRTKNKVDRLIKLYTRSPKIKSYVAYLSAFIFLNIFIYISIPFFFNYSKSTINKYCSALEIQCVVDGKIKYTFFPSPRLKFNNLIILDSDKKKLLNAKNVSIKIHINGLAKQDEFKFTKVEIKNSEINFYFNDLKRYKKIVNKTDFVNPFVLKKSKIIFFDNNQKIITTIRDANIEGKSFNDVVLKGIFLDDEIQINYEKNETNDKSLVLKLIQSKILAKINIFEQKEEEKSMKGDLLFKKDKNRVRSVFAYKNDQIVFKNADLRNEFLNGNLAGYIKFLPFFDFDLDLDLKGFNFKRLYTYLGKMKKEEFSKLFKINYKINGTINLNANKIYSQHGLINSFESYIKFSNGNIVVDKLLLNLGRLGAADVAGIIKTDKKYTNFKFESNVYVDSKKYFRRKFSIFDKQKISNNLFTSGTLDLVNFNMRFDEITGDIKFKDEEISYIEKEFNYYMLDDGVVSFFNFNKFKEFMKSTISD